MDDSLLGHQLKSQRDNNVLNLSGVTINTHDKVKDVTRWMKENKPNEIILDHCSITTHILVQLLKTLRDNEFLHFLSLRGNSINEKGLASLIDFLSSKPSIESIDILGNDFYSSAQESKAAVEGFLSFFADSKSLKSLCGCGPSRPELSIAEAINHPLESAIIQEELRKSSDILSLQLMSVVGVSDVVEAIETSKSLIRAKFTALLLDSDTCLAFNICFQVNTDLKTLEIVFRRNHPLSEDATGYFVSFFKSMSANHTISTLYLDSLPINPEIMTALAAFVRQSRSLVHLGLYNAQLSDADVSILAAGLRGNTHLRMVHISLLASTTSSSAQRPSVHDLSHTAMESIKEAGSLRTNPLILRLADGIEYVYEGNSSVQNQNSHHHHDHHKKVAKPADEWQVGDNIEAQFDEDYWLPATIANVTKDRKYGVTFRNGQMKLGYRGQLIRKGHAFQRFDYITPPPSQGILTANNTAESPSQNMTHHSSSNTPPPSSAGKTDRRSDPRSSGEHRHHSNSKHHRNHHQSSHANELSLSGDNVNASHAYGSSTDVLESSLGSNEPLVAATGALSINDIIPTPNRLAGNSNTAVAVVEAGGVLPASAYAVDQHVQARFVGSGAWYAATIVNVYAELNLVDLQFGEAAEFFAVDFVDVHWVRPLDITASVDGGSYDVGIYKRGDYVETFSVEDSWRRCRLAVDRKNGTYDVRLENGVDVKAVPAKFLRHNFRANDRVDCLRILCWTKDDDTGKAKPIDISSNSTSKKKLRKRTEGSGHAIWETATILGRNNADGTYTLRFENDDVEIRSVNPKRLTPADRQEARNNAMEEAKRENTEAAAFAAANQQQQQQTKEQLLSPGLHSTPQHHHHLHHKEQQQQSAAQAPQSVPHEHHHSHHRNHNHPEQQQDKHHKEKEELFSRTTPNAFPAFASPAVAGHNGHHDDHLDGGGGEETPERTPTTPGGTAIIKVGTKVQVQVAPGMPWERAVVVHKNSHRHHHHHGSGEDAVEVHFKVILDSEDHERSVHAHQILPLGAIPPASAPPTPARSSVSANGGMHPAPSPSTYYNTPAAAAPATQSPHRPSNGAPSSLNSGVKSPHHHHRHRSYNDHLGGLHVEDSGNSNSNSNTAELKSDVATTEYYAVPTKKAALPRTPAAGLSAAAAVSSAQLQENLQQQQQHRNHNHKHEEDTTQYRLPAAHHDNSSSDDNNRQGGDRDHHQHHQHNHQHHQHHHIRNKNKQETAVPEEQQQSVGAVYYAAEKLEQYDASAIPTVRRGGGLQRTPPTAVAPSNSSFQQLQQQQQQQQQQDQSVDQQSQSVSAGIASEAHQRDDEEDYIGQKNSSHHNHHNHHLQNHHSKHQQHHTRHVPHQASSSTTPAAALPSGRVDGEDATEENPLVARRELQRTPVTATTATTATATTTTNAAASAAQTASTPFNIEQHGHHRHHHNHHHHHHQNHTPATAFHAAAIFDGKTHEENTSATSLVGQEVDAAPKEEGGTVAGAGAGATTTPASTPAAVLRATSVISSAASKEPLSELSASPYQQQKPSSVLVSAPAVSVSPSHSNVISSYKGPAFSSDIEAEQLIPEVPLLRKSDSSSIAKQFQQVPDDYNNNNNSNNNNSNSNNNNTVAGALGGGGGDNNNRLREFKALTSFLVSSAKMKDEKSAAEAAACLTANGCTSLGDFSELAITLSTSSSLTSTTSMLYHINPANVPVLLSHRIKEDSENVRHFLQEAGIPLFTAAKLSAFLVKQPVYLSFLQKELHAQNISPAQSQSSEQPQNILL